jgi:hypothetical protein
MRATGSCANVALLRASAADVGKNTSALADSAPQPLPGAPFSARSTALAAASDASRANTGGRLASCVSVCSVATAACSLRASAGVTIGHAVAPPAA